MTLIVDLHGITDAVKNEHTSITLKVTELEIRKSHFSTIRQLNDDGVKTFRKLYIYCSSRGNPIPPRPHCNSDSVLLNPT